MSKTWNPDSKTRPTEPSRLPYETDIPTKDRLQDDAEEEITRREPTPLPMVEYKDWQKADHLVVLSGTNVGQVFSLTRTELVVGRDKTAEIRLTDLGVSRRHARLTRSEGGPFVIQDLESSNGTYVNSEAVTDAPRLLCTQDIIRLGSSTVLKFLAQGEPEIRYALSMYRAAMTDGLSGVFNRRYLEMRLVSEVASARRHGTPLSLLLLDLDLFKEVNDTHGHIAGDQVLESISGLIRNNIRTEDVMARYGGDEFAIICPHTTAEDAAILGERLRGLVSGHGLVIEHSTCRLTLSVGVAGLQGDLQKTAEALLDDADQALLQAKEQGRNRVCIHGPGPGE